MTYDVFGGTLNLALSVYVSQPLRRVLIIIIINLRIVGV